MAHIIIADDDELVCEIARGALTGSGHVVGVVSNGVDAVNAVRAKRPDLLILDCNMPEKTGITALRELRNMPAFSEMPVLMLTARRSDQDQELARYAGATDYLKKPFDPDELIFRVEELLAPR
jgi:DNA-binding response OmpR family regulator